MFWFNYWTMFNSTFTFFDQMSEVEESLLFKTVRGFPMNLLAIVGSPRKGKATDSFVDKAIEGAKSKSPDLHVHKIHLADETIHYCKNCLTCRDRPTDEPISKCSIWDDKVGQRVG